MFSSLQGNQEIRRDCIYKYKIIEMTLNNLQYSPRLILKQRVYCSNKNIKGVCFIKKMNIRT